MKTKNYLSLALLLGALAIQSGCSDRLANPMRIGTNIWPGYEPLYLAKELGFLDDQPVKLIEFTSASQAIRQFRNNSINAAALTLDEVLVLVQDGFKPRVVLVMDISHGGDVIVAKPGIEKMRDLKSKRIGLEKSALGAYVMARALELNNMTIGDVDPINMDHGLHEHAFEKQKVDAVVTFEPAKSKLLAKGGKVVFDSRSIPGEIVDVLVVRESYLKENPGVVRGLIVAWYKALEHMKMNPNQAYSLMAKRMKLTAEQSRQSFDGLLMPGKEKNRSMLCDVRQEDYLPRTADKLANLMKSQKILSPQVDTSGIELPAFSCSR